MRNEHISVPHGEFYAVRTPVFDQITSPAELYRRPGQTMAFQIEQDKKNLARLVDPNSSVSDFTFGHDPTNSLETTEGFERQGHYLNEAGNKFIAIYAATDATKELFVADAIFSVRKALLEEGQSEAVGEIVAEGRMIKKKHLSGNESKVPLTSHASAEGNRGHGDRCRICHFDTVLDDRQIEHVGGCICVRCYTRETDSQVRMSKGLRQELSGVLAGCEVNENET